MSMSELPVLIVEDDPDLLDALCATLRLGGHRPLAATNGSEALAVLERERVGLVVSDVQMQPTDGLTLLERIRERDPGLPVMLMTAYAEIEKAVAAMRAGACDYLAKPFEPQRLLQMVKRFLPPPSHSQLGDFVAQDPRSRELLALAERVAKSGVTVMVTGESGSGKEILARYIHRHSGRADKPFVAVNCAAIPENLLEATLFGYEKGAFTGAFRSQPGKFEQAQEGTLLLDEVSEMPLALQAKLLRVLQEKEVERVGGRKAVSLDVRVIATSNRDVSAMVASGGFREDLYYRLNVFPMVVPPLRERPLDILPLAQHMLRKHGAWAADTEWILTGPARERLMRHSWPGNVRELENVMQRALILAGQGPIEERHIVLGTGVGKQRTNEDGDAGGEWCAATDLKSVERAHIIRTLTAVNGSRKLAVQRLGISERTLRNKLRQYRLAGCIGERGA
jgi:two-component system response regulator FlrC